MGLFAAEKQETHRPGVFKKPNKPHKTGRHRSKGSISSDAGGKVSVKRITKYARKELSKNEKRNQLNQIRSNKRKEALDKKRSIGSEKTPPILIAIVPLQEDLDVHSIANLLTNADEEAVITASAYATHISIPRFKQRFSIVVPPVGNMFATLDAVKVANTVLFVTSAVHKSDKSQRNEVIDLWGEEIIHSITAQGLPSPILAVTNLECLPIQKRQDYKKHVLKMLFKWLPEEKIMNLDKAADALNVIRCAGSQKQRSIYYRNKRPYLLAENVKFDVDDDSTNNFGTLEVSGYLRGLPLSVYGLLHIPGFGDYQMTRIEKCKDPFPLGSQKSKSGADVHMDETEVYVVEDPSKQESLASEAEVDPMDAEQTWPTEDDYAEALERKKVVKRVPKGTSEYQAAWILDEDEEEENSENSDEEIEDVEMAADEAKSEVNSDDEYGNTNEEDTEEYETITVSETTNEERYDEKMDLHEEKEALIKLKEAKLDSEFPDEIDTPQDVLARVRFQKYRGLDSFRHTRWEADNNPEDYKRIFAFETFDQTRRRIFKDQESLESERKGKKVEPGSYITIHIKGISKELFEAFRVSDQPLVIFGLLELEQKMSIVNVVLKRTLNSTIPIKSKERLVFQCGFRRFTACPIFSQHTNGNKHKFERFFQPNSTVVATMYAQMLFPPCPVICYLEKTDGNLEMVATGSVISIDPNRLVIKRIVLSGHPFKVHKKSAVVRFMFFNRDDIIWYKPVKLRTKYGRKGHIKEPLGTHGHMKCIFDGKLKSQDTVLMNLYKRVFPKWTYEPLLLKITSNKESNDVNME